MEDQKIQNITIALQELMEDNSVPKNVRTKVQTIIKVLQEENSDIEIRINKALQELDEISEDTNLQTYTRTQIWNIASLLEMIGSKN